MVASWLVGTLVTGGFIFANLRVNRDDRIAAYQGQQRADATLAEAHRKIEALQPKPLKVRVIDFLNRLDPKIIPALRNGQTEFGGQLTYAQLAELQNLTHEDSAGQFIIYIPSSNFIMNEPGKIGDQRFRLTPEVAK